VTVEYSVNTLFDIFQGIIFGNIKQFTTKCLLIVKVIMFLLFI